jgi:hypothetical protein
MRYKLVQRGESAGVALLTASVVTAVVRAELKTRTALQGEGGAITMPSCCFFELSGGD